MNEVKLKHRLPVITADLYNIEPDRYELRSGAVPDAPLCPFGNNYEWVGFDRTEEKYVRFTKSVFKRLIKLKEHGKVLPGEEL